MDKIAAYHSALESHYLWASEEDLIKTASAEEVQVYDHMCKVAQYGSEEDVIALIVAAHELGLDKEASLLAKGMGALGGALGRIGKATGSKTLSSAGAKTLSSASGVAQRAAGRTGGKLVKAEEGLRGGGLRLTQKAQSQRDLSRRLAGQAATTARQTQSAPGARANMAESVGKAKDRLLGMFGRKKSPAAPANSSVGGFSGSGASSVASKARGRAADRMRSRQGSRGFASRY